MQEDFKQERRWKRNMAKVVGGWILQYYKTGSRIIEEDVLFSFHKIGISVE
jgi:hypothetical protein